MTNSDKTTTTTTTTTTSTTSTSEQFRISHQPFQQFAGKRVRPRGTVQHGHHHNTSYSNTFLLPPRTAFFLGWLTLLLSLRKEAAAAATRLDSSTLVFVSCSILPIFAFQDQHDDAMFIFPRKKSRFVEPLRWLQQQPHQRGLAVDPEAKKELEDEPENDFSKCVVSQECSLCTGSERDDQPECRPTGRIEKLSCIPSSSSRSQGEDAEANAVAKSRSCKRTRSDDEFLMVRLQVFCLLIGSFAFMSVRRQRVVSASLFDQRKLAAQQQQQQRQRQYQQQLQQQQQEQANQRSTEYASKKRSSDGGVVELMRTRSADDESIPFITESRSLEIV